MGLQREQRGDDEQVDLPAARFEEPAANGVWAVAPTPRAIVCFWHTERLPTGGFSSCSPVLPWPSSDPREKSLSRTLYYLFDPLCGWCYGAGAAVAALAGSDAVDLELLPSGLFQDEGARPLDAAFAAYAWANDQRIERLTGQPFSRRYREEVLANRTQRFDSGPATLALTAVNLTAPGSEVEALKVIQHARYVEGQDVTQQAVLCEALRSLGLTDAAQRMQASDDTLRAAAKARIHEARALMRRVGAQGVPTFVLDSEVGPQLLPAGAVHSDPQAFLDRLTASPA